MPLRGTALKRFKLSERNRKKNHAISSELKTRIKTAHGALAENAPDAEELLKTALRKLDKAVSKGVIHKCNAARRKSRLQRKFNAPQ